MPYLPTDHNLTSKPLSVLKAGLDSRSMFKDLTKTPTIYRAYQSMAEANTYLSNAIPSIQKDIRSGFFPIFIDGGTLDVATGIFTNSSVKEYWYRNGQSNGNLEEKVPNLSGYATESFVNQRIVDGTAGVATFNGRSGAVMPAANDYAVGQISGLSGVLANKADLVGGVIPRAQIPSIAITEFLGNSANQAAMLALTGQKGDWTIRTDQNKVWVITGNDSPNTISNWTSLAYPVNTDNITDAESAALMDLKDTAVYESIVEDEQIKEELLPGYLFANGFVVGDPVDNVSEIVIDNAFVQALFTTYLQSLPGYVNNNTVSLRGNMTWETAGASLPTPSAPTTPVSNDTSFGWTDTGGKTFADAEVKIGAAAYVQANGNPHTGITGAYAPGEVLVRYKAVDGVSAASAALANTVAFTEPAQGGGGTEETLTLNSIQGLTNTAGVLTPNTIDGLYHDHYALFNKKLAAGNDGYIEILYDRTKNQFFNIGFSTSNTLANMEYNPNVPVMIIENNNIIIYQGLGTPQSYATADLDNRRIRLYRTGAQLILKKAEVNDTETVIHTFPNAAPTGDLFIVATMKGENDAKLTISTMKGFNLSA